MYGSVAKWAAQIDSAARIPEYVARAWRLAISGRPGPVVLALPEDMLVQSTTNPPAPKVVAVDCALGATTIAQVRDMLDRARSPLVIAGGSRWNAAACAQLRSLSDATGLPVACAFRQQDLFDNRHPHYAGDVGIGPNPALAARVRAADVLLVIGERLGEMVTSGYTLLEVPQPRQALIHVHPSPDELGHVYQPRIAVAATPDAFLVALNTSSPGAHAGWREAAVEAHAQYEAWRAPRAVPGKVDLWQIVTWLDQRLPDDAILTNGAGNYSVWLHRIYRYRQFRTQLAPYSGSMGYGVPSAIAAKIAHPDRVVVSWNGDGCFLMNGQELATAVQYGLPIVFVVVDNGMYGTIRMHQERHYPGRVSGTDLVNPDFAALARAYGATGETVTQTSAFAPAFERAIASAKPALLHVVIDPQALTMNASLDAIRAQAQAGA
jgi:acetolactate synthase I/II/III large subunit